MKYPEELTILKRCLRDYKENYVLLVPPLMLTLTGYLLVYSLVNMHVPIGLSLADTLPRILAFIFVAFLCEIGLANMSANIMTTGTCKVSDWWVGVRRYFWRLLNIGILLAILFAIISTPISLLLINVPRIVERSVSTIAFSVFFLLHCVSFAAATIDNKGARLSIRIGWRTIRASGRVFLSFMALYIVYSEVGVLERSHVIDRLTNLVLVSSLISNGLTLPSIGYSIIQLFLAPLWFLITFRIYEKEAKA